MMDLFVWLEHTPIANAIRTTRSMYPTFETSHYIGLALLVGGIMLDRPARARLRAHAAAQEHDRAAAVVWVGFLINVLSGSMLFIYGATNFGVNHAFWLKMTFMVLAGLNALAFDLLRAPLEGRLGRADLPPLYVKAFATLSFVLWLCVVTTGRWMAYI